MDPPCPTFRSESDEESPLDPLVAVLFQISHIPEEPIPEASWTLGARVGKVN